MSEKDWQEVVWEIKDKISEETKELTSKEFWEFLKRETESTWERLQKSKVRE